MKLSDGLSITDKLVLAAYDLEESGKQPFSAEDLVVSAWEKFPDAFGLQGHTDASGLLLYPDSNRVFAEIMGSKPIRARGLLKKVGSKMYQLTEAGRDRARVLSVQPTEARIAKASLERPTQETLKRLFTSKAVEKFKNGRSADITFYEACAFWGISPSSSAIELNGQINNFKKIVQAAVNAVGSGQVSFGHGGYAFGRDDLKVLQEVHDYLRRTFSEELSVIRRRTDERR